MTPVRELSTTSAREVCSLTALSILGFASVFLLSAASATEPPLAATASLKKLSVEQLMNIEVTSVSRTTEVLEGAAAAVAVLTGDDIRRSGATSVPEALRLLPGIHVGQRNANSWAVSARGFSSINSEKLLVLSDTRSLYTPLFSGVLWDVQDYLLEDIERIEVIRGPGAALWGSNAVNGVINITSKSAEATQGLYLEAAAGEEQRQMGAARYGGKWGERAHYRVYGKYFDRDASLIPEGGSEDDWHLAHFGIRSDWEAGAGDVLTVQADVYRGTVGIIAPSVTIIGRQGPTGNLTTDVSGGNVLARWRHSIDAGSDLQLRAYYDRTERNDPSFEDELETIDLDLQHRFALSARQEAIWGLNYRFVRHRNEGGGIFAVQPPSSRDHLVSAFVQDQITLKDALRITLGTKLEHNDFSGFEVQPSARAAWDFLPAHTVWGSVSRAVRVPTRLERDIRIDLSDPPSDPVGRLLGNEDFESEELLAYELGYRWQALAALSIDLAAFHNRYQGLASLEIGVPFIDPTDGRTVFPIVHRNLTDGETQGVEALVTVAPLPYWHLTASYSYIDIELDPAGADLNRGVFVEGATPRHQFGLRSSLDLPGGFQVDALYRNSSAIRRLPEIVTGEGIPGYAEFDIRLAWRGDDNLEVSLVGQNLLHEHHTEFGAPAARGKIERGVYGKISWHF